MRQLARQASWRAPRTVAPLRLPARTRATLQSNIATIRLEGDPVLEVETKNLGKLEWGEGGALILVEVMTHSLSSLVCL